VPEGKGGYRDSGAGENRKVTIILLEGWIRGTL